MNILRPTPHNIALAAEAIRAGELVVIPTETVYGLACDAFNPAAIAKVYAAKGRPASNPLIVHIAEFRDLTSVAAEVPLAAMTLARKFWPGPLTLVLERADTLPKEVSAGLRTVGVRMPSHPVAQLLIEAAHTALAAPSANPFTRLTPTRARHVDEKLAAQAAFVLDGGDSAMGIESTVVDMTQGLPEVLRLGAISRADLEAAMGIPFVIAEERDGPQRSPGTHEKHYSPKAKLIVADAVGDADAGLVFHEPKNDNQIQMPAAPKEFAKRLYSELHELDSRGLDTILVEAPPVTLEWEAIWDRLRRAAKA